MNVLWGLEAGSFRILSIFNIAYSRRELRIASCTRHESPQYVKLRSGCLWEATAMRLSKKDFDLWCQTLLRLYQPRNLETLRQVLPEIFAKILPAAGAVAAGPPPSQSAKSFSERDRFILNLLQPHIVQVFRTARFISSLEQRKAAVLPDKWLGERYTLSERESEVVRWVLEGKSNAEISLILHLSRRTVEKHMEHILPKLGVENRTTAIAMFARMNLRPEGIGMDAKR